MFSRYSSMAARLEWCAGECDGGEEVGGWDKAASGGGGIYLFYFILAVFR